MTILLNQLSATFINTHIKAVFNLMNAVIGAGIIGLAYVASVLGYVQFIFMIIIGKVLGLFLDCKNSSG